MKILLLFILIMPIFSFLKFILFDLVDSIDGKPKNKRAKSRRVPSAKTSTYREYRRKAQ
ncbi:hypothetical protein Curi_c01050 [Gottschalkia acidurici 9a]|uniref:Uncharacterized protein n=1 Tax=Gottschalkia acidurici (strain ATCC 7906 / DSM 604 / BCRC 14475 / CIP 104303 / KCTC 5404 / NCIMB 10678 / 9a) TaxID=1128398 RepID=K0AWS4_GOTA9|nr:hypothetical protein [Gottschalkia acidurici]AFS77185.1 hypothetical protein Curi_c01050 [Gottschalkia acidurici 9a]